MQGWRNGAANSYTGTLVMINNRKIDRFVHISFRHNPDFAKQRVLFDRNQIMPDKLKDCEKHSYKCGLVHIWVEELA